MGKYNDEVKTVENLAEDFFYALEVYVNKALMKDNKDAYLKRIVDLIKEYKPKMVK